MSKLKKVKLGAVLDVKRGASLSGEFYSKAGIYKRLTLGNFTYPQSGWKENLSKDDIYFIGPFKQEFLLHKGDIITPLTEQVRGLLGNTAFIPEDNVYIQSGDIGLIIPNVELLDKTFAYYLVSSPGVKKQLDGKSQQTKIRHTSPDAIKDCVAYIPPLDKQKKIGKILFAIDESIKNNNALSSTLEETAKTLYDYWFTQFDFPNEEGKPYRSSGGKMVWNEELKREIPEGWEVIRLRDISYYVSEKISNTYLSENTYIGTDNLLPDMKGRTFSAYVPHEGLSTKYMCGDILISNIRPYFKKILKAQGEGGCSADVLCIRGKDKDTSGFIYGALARNAFFEYDMAGSKGSKMPRGDKTHIMNYPIVFSKEIAVKYSEIIDKLYSLIEVKYQDNQQLVSLRDNLLPLLMNGQVTIGE